VAPGDRAAPPPPPPEASSAPQTLQVQRERNAIRWTANFAVGARSIQNTYCCSPMATCSRTATRTALPLGHRRDRRCSCAACSFRASSLAAGRAGEFRRREGFLNGDGEDKRGLSLSVQWPMRQPKKGRAMMLCNDHEHNKAVTFHSAVTASLFFWVVLSCSRRTPFCRACQWRQPCNPSILRQAVRCGAVRWHGTYWHLPVVWFPRNARAAGGARIQPIAPTKGNPSRWRRLSWPAFPPRAAAAAAPGAPPATARQVATYAARAGCGLPRRASPCVPPLSYAGRRMGGEAAAASAPAGHFRRAVGATHVSAWTPGLSSAWRPERLAVFPLACFNQVS
jgi:hypothetical protein